jgi:hypothetical protein
MLGGWGTIRSCFGECFFFDSPCYGLKVAIVLGGLRDLGMVDANLLYLFVMRKVSLVEDSGPF